MAKIFISYSSKDKDFVRQLAADLQELGHKPWLDEWEIKVGECIVTKIEEGVSSSDYVVLVLTPQSVSSGWVEREWKTAYWSEIEKRRILVLPILLKDCEVPPLLKTKKYADFRKSYAVGFAQLIQPITPISLQEQESVLIKTAKDDREVSKLIERVQGKQVQHTEDKMGNIIVDLRVLSDKCNRDVDRKYPFTYEYYLKELNRILAELGQIQPVTFGDMGLIEDAKNKSQIPGAMTGEQDAKLREISAVADKLLSRLHQTINTQNPKVSTVGREKNSISVGNEFEVVLLGTVDMTIECMMRFTKKLDSQGHSYKSNAKIGGHPDYAKPDRTCSATVTIAEITEGKEGQIGTIELQLIPDEKTLFKTSHPKERDSSFNYFLDALFAEFEQLGFIKKEKTTIEDLPPETLVAKADWEAIESEFGVTKRSFGKKINFITDTFRRTIIFRDAEQAFALASSGFSKPAVILAGGVIEELLRLYLEHKQIKPIKNDFDGYIQTCEQHRLLKESVSRLSHSVRQFRNLVHLSAEETKKHTISKATAIGAVSSIFTIANDF